MDNCPHKIDETALVKLKLIFLPPFLCFSTFHNGDNVFNTLNFADDVQILHEANAGFKSDCDLILNINKFVENIPSFMNECSIWFVIFAVHKLSVELLTDIHLNN